MKAYGTSYLFNAKNWEKIGNLEFDKKEWFLRYKFQVNIFTKSWISLRISWTDLHKFSLKWMLMILAP